MSQAAAELQQYCLQNAGKDALLVGVPTGSNPFREPRSCTVVWRSGTTHNYSLPLPFKVYHCNYFALSARRKKSKSRGVLHRRIYTFKIKCHNFYCIHVNLDNISIKILQRSTFISVFERPLSNYLKFTQRGCVSQCGLQIAAWNFAVSQLPMLGEKPERKLCLPVQENNTWPQNLCKRWNAQDTYQNHAKHLFCPGILVFRVADYFSLKSSLGRAVHWRGVTPSSSRDAPLGLNNLTAPVPYNITTNTPHNPSAGAFGLEMVPIIIKSYITNMQQLFNIEIAKLSEISVMLKFTAWPGYLISASLFMAFEKEGPGTVTTSQPVGLSYNR